MDDKDDKDFEQLISKKELHFIRCQTLFELSKSTPPERLPELNLRLKELHSSRECFEQCIFEINSIYKKANPKFVPSYQEIQTFDEMYFRILSAVEANSEIWQSCDGSGSAPSARSAAHGPGAGGRDSRSAKPRLPKLELFHFDSKLENWQTFYDTFTSLIHNNNDITNIEKFYYLLSAVSGSALTVVKGMPVTADNYPIVWALLVKKFENTRALATSYLDRLFQFKPLSSESATGLNAFLQTYQECVKALKLLKINNLSSFILFYMGLRNLDPVTRREFEQSADKTDIPTYEQLVQFVEKQARVLEMSEVKISTPKSQTMSKSVPNTFTKPNFVRAGNNNSANNSSTPKQFQKPCLSAVSKNNSERINKCLFCDKPHSTYRCFEFFDLTPVQRLDKVKQLKLCENCFRQHPLSECTSKVRCVLCKQPHHHSLHLDTVPSVQSVQFQNQSANTANAHCQNASSSQNMSSSQKVSSSQNVSNNQGQGQRSMPNVGLTCSSNSTVLLGTAVVHVADRWGAYHTVRAVIDSGAMSGYMTTECAQRLGLSRRKCQFEPMGLGGTPVQDFGLVTCSIKPRNSSGPVLSTDTVVVSSITSDLPTVTLSNKVIDNFKNLELADPNYFSAAPVDLLIAGDLFPYIYDGQNILPRDPGLPVAMHSIFGYIITGQTLLGNDCASNTASLSLFSANATSSIDKIMNSFWETENVPCDVTKKPEDLYVEQLFQNEHSRDSTGRFTVTYPFKPSFELGDSTPQALRRFNNLENKLNRLPELKEEYNKFMSEYESLGHMTCVGDLGSVDSKYIIPHFCVLRPSSTTTKLRVVFDASCKTTNNNSLNSVVYAGPKLQADINEILINFRVHEICLSSDICKMFRMTLIAETQRKYQHILWRFQHDQPIKVYELNTITYGVASSPYLAIRVLHQLADDDAEKYPLASKVLKKGFFVDDLLWSVSTFEEAAKLQDELLGLLSGGGFLLRKWASNCPQMLARVPADYRETPLAFEDDKDLSIKVLGLQWRPAEDSFSFVFNSLPASQAITKRNVLSQIGRQYDPLGFVAPCIFYAKCFMQKLWLQQLGWDDKLPPELEKEWLAYMSELPLLSNFRHERQATVKQHSYYQLLGFCDASVQGIAAVIYLRSFNDQGETKVSLVIAKSKVAPLKTVTIPRLELMAAHLLAKLVKYTKSILFEQISINDVFLFTDSSVVLSWLNTPSYNLKTFVASRVSKIMETVSSDCWYHVSGASNPADVCSRGALPSALLATAEWLSGPSWLDAPQENWPIKSIDQFKSANVPELKIPCATLVQTSLQDTTCNSNMIFDLTEKYSSFGKLQNVLARCFQFVNNCRSTRSNRNKGPPSLLDSKNAHDVLIKSVQRQHFATDIDAISKGNSCSPSLKRLAPYVDPLGFLRVGGRLSLSDLSYQKKYPLLLPKKCNFTKILIDYFHKIYLHVGPRTLHSIISQKYWIIAGKCIVRSRFRKCIKCFKVNPSSLQPIMGNLPKFRIQGIYAFHTVGVDIGGPFYTKESNRRNAKISKSYLLLLVCFSTRAVHAEVLSALSTESFFAAFDRFTARRGLCQTIVSDNGKNFVSAGRQLSEIRELFSQNTDDFSTGFNTRSVNWIYNPPTGSHFGGAYESGIKSAKLLLKRVVGARSLSFEELTTIFARVEAVLNSRPLTSASSDPSEFEALTPGHFLVGRPLLAVPEHDLSDEPTYGLTRWQLVQQASQQFWKMWQKDYLHTLQQRQKWQSNCRNMKIGELVLIHADAPPLQWHLGRITELYPGADGVVRVVKVKTQNGEYKRPVVKLSPLPMELDSE